MNDFADLEVVARRGYLRPRSFDSVEHAADLVESALAFARARGVTELVADVTPLAGFPTPTIAERFWIIGRWAAAGGNLVRLAVVAHPPHIDPGRFGVIVATTRGLAGEVFASEPEAVAWLDGLPRVVRALDFPVRQSGPT